MLRAFLAGFAGLLIASLLVLAVEFTNSRLFPFPAGFNPSDPQQIAAFIKTMPVGAFVAVWFGWASGAFAGTFAARKLTPAPSNRPAIVTAVLFELFCIFNMAMLPHPVAFIVANVVTTPLAAWAALTLANRPSGSTPVQA